MTIGERNRTKDAPIGKISNAKRTSGTDWNKLRRLGDAAIHKGIKADPDAHPTDEQFWKDAKLESKQFRDGPNGTLPQAEVLRAA
jgi:hypothetical protein